MKCECYPNCEYRQITQYGAETVKCRNLECKDRKNGPNILLPMDKYGDHPYNTRVNNHV